MASVTCNSHREYTEVEIAERPKAMTDRLASLSTALFNIHVPPYNSRIDTAPMLNPDLAVETSGGAQITGPVGPTAVRTAIEDVQPLVTLHGHIHECGGSVRIGRTVAINAGLGVRRRTFCAGGRYGGWRRTTATAGGHPLVA